jgi:hypothetical protein
MLKLCPLQARNKKFCLQMAFVSLSALPVILHGYVPADQVQIENPLPNLVLMGLAGTLESESPYIGTGPGRLPFLPCLK